MYRLFFKGPVIFYRLRGGVEDFGRTHGSRGERGGEENHLSPKGYKKGTIEY